MSNGGKQNGEEETHLFVFVGLVNLTLLEHDLVLGDEEGVEPEVKYLGRLKSKQWVGLDEAANVQMRKRK